MDNMVLRWRKIVSRKSDLQKSLQFACLGKHGFGSFFNISDLKHQLYYFDGRATNIYFDEQDFAAFSAAALLRFESIDFIQAYEKRVMDICTASLQKAESLVQKIEQAKEGKAVLVLFQEFDDLWNVFYPPAWSFFYTSNFSDIVEQKLMQKGFSTQKSKEIIEIAACPDRLTPITAAEHDLFRLAALVKNTPEKANTFAERMVEQYGWMSVYNTDDEPRTASYYLEEARNISSTGIDVNKRLKELEAEQAAHNNAFQEMISTIDDSLLNAQLKLIHAAGYLRDKREEVRDRITMFARSLYETIAYRTRFSLREVVHLTNNEIEKLLTNEREHEKLRSLAQARQQRFLFVVKQKNAKVIDDSQEMNAFVQQLAYKKQDSVKGKVAYASQKIVRGKAKIVLSNKEVAKVQKGDILIVSMTKPDFLPAMKKAAAFVTDEGGITCHAAIIARELKKLCIIGTNNATQVFKDGDIVEVDANNGIIRIIK